MIWRSWVQTQSLMAEWLEQASQWHEVYCHDLEVMSSNPVTDGRVVRAGVSVTWNVLSWSGGHEFEGVHSAFCPTCKSYLIQIYQHHIWWITCLMSVQKRRSEYHLLWNTPFTFSKPSVHWTQMKMKRNYAMSSFFFPWHNFGYNVAYISC